MSKDQLIQETSKKIALLDEQSLQSISDYAEYLLSKNDDRELIMGMTKLADRKSVV